MIVGLEQTKVTVSEGSTSLCCVVIINGTTTTSFVIQIASIPNTASLCNFYSYCTV